MSFHPLLCVICVWTYPQLGLQQLEDGEITASQVLSSVDRARRFLIKSQDTDGSWKPESIDFVGAGSVVGVSSLALLALLNAGMTASDSEIARGLDWLRKQEPRYTYDISLMIQALTTANDRKRDAARVHHLVRMLEEMQIQKGNNVGSWSYSRNFALGDRSNAQFAVLGLRDAQEINVPVAIEVWRKARNHWLTSQNSDGGWGYSPYSGYLGGNSYGSMTVAGIAALVVTAKMLTAEEGGLNPDGTPVCCVEPKVDKPVNDACQWLADRFQVTNNPGGDGSWVLYYLYGLERAGRFSGRRFFVNSRGERHDWYREGAKYLVSHQRISGAWHGVGPGEGDPIIATSFALIFLSKGLAPVLINKLQYGPRDATGKEVVGNDWNWHPHDVGNLTHLITNIPKWPRLLNWQTVSISQATVSDLMQAPILFISGSEAPQLPPQDIALLKEYIVQGGFIFVVNNCRSAAFDEGIRDLIRQMYPASEAALKKLTGDHLVFRSEFNLIEKDTGEPLAELWGLDVGCRTSIMYSPHDVSCLWDKWISFEKPGRPKELVSMVEGAMHLGVNVVAYVTGREILNKLQQQEQAVVSAGTDKIERDLLQIPKIHYVGDWDPAPQALRSLLFAVNKTSGVAVSVKQRDLTLSDLNLFRYPIVYMHGRQDFSLGKDEQEKLRKYITQGGVLFSDACCGLAPYDRGFRRLMEQCFPDNRLKRIPRNHEIFTAKVGYDLKTVRRREGDVDDANGIRSSAVREVEPFLEGIEVNGRFVVIYSKFDVSCALQRQASVACIGHVHEDAIKIGVNVIRYALLQ